MSDADRRVSPINPLSRSSNCVNDTYITQAQANKTKSEKSNLLLIWSVGWKCWVCVFVCVCIENVYWLPTWFLVWHCASVCRYMIFVIRKQKKDSSHSRTFSLTLFLVRWQFSYTLKLLIHTIIIHIQLSNKFPIKYITRELIGALQI